MARAVLPFPSEEQAKALYWPRKNFSIGCLLAGLLTDTYLLAIFLMLLLRYIKSGHARTDSLFTRLCVVGATFTTLGVTGITALFTQSFFTYRAFLLNGGNWFILVAAGSKPRRRAETSLASTLAVKIIFASLASARDSKNVYVPTAIWLSSTTATDLLITGAILVGLLKSRTSWSTTNRLITRLVRLTLEAQVPATISAVVYLGAFLTRRASPVTIAIVYFQSKLYAFGLLYSLNARQLLSARQAVNDTSSLPGFQSPRHLTSLDPTEAGPGDELGRGAGAREELREWARGGREDERMRSAVRVEAWEAGK